MFTLLVLTDNSNQQHSVAALSDVYWLEQTMDHNGAAVNHSSRRALGHLLPDIMSCAPTITQSITLQRVFLPMYIDNNLKRLVHKAAMLWLWGWVPREFNVMRQTIIKKGLFINPIQFHFVSLITQVLCKSLRALTAMGKGGIVCIVHSSCMHIHQNRCVSLISDVGVINAVCQWWLTQLNPWSSSANKQQRPIKL